MTPLECDLGGRPVDVLFAGLAPGFIGYYQVSIRLPADAPRGGASLSCGADTLRIAIQ